VYASDARLVDRLSCREVRPGAAVVIAHINAAAVQTVGGDETQGGVDALGAVWVDDDIIDGVPRTTIDE